MDKRANYAAKQERLIQQLRAINTLGGPIAVAKRTSNLFRTRKQTSGQKLNFKDLNQLISIDVKNRIAEVEAAITYKDLVDATLQHGLMPAVVPQFITITVGGAVSGGACEASSFKYGAVHETVAEMTVLLSDATVVTATPNNEHKDLFFALPHTFGSLGYILKLKLKLVPVQPFVKLEHTHFTSSTDYFEAIASIMKTGEYKNQPVDFLDGVIFDAKSLHLTTARFADEAPFTSDYTYMNVYYKSIATKDGDYLKTRDFIWRWDADWAWGSALFGMQNRVLRLLFGKFVLNSFAYWKLVNLDRRFGIAKKLQRLHPSAKPQETIIQDVEVPIERGNAYLQFFLSSFDLRPIWVCPLKSYRSELFTFTGLKPNTPYINFGLWGSVTSSQSRSPHYYNRLLETTVGDYGGHKALYSTNFYPEAEFWKLFSKKQYDALRAKYDPNGRLKDFYHKVCKEQV